MIGVSNGPKLGFLHAMGWASPVSISHSQSLTGVVTPFLLKTRQYFFTTVVRVCCWKGVRCEISSSVRNMFPCLDSSYSSPKVGSISCKFEASCLRFLISRPAWTSGSMDSHSSCGSGWQQSSKRGLLKRFFFLFIEAGNLLP